MDALRPRRVPVPPFVSQRFAFGGRGHWSLADRQWNSIVSG